MAIKKFLMEGSKQVWPITRADCVYTVDGTQLLNVAIKEQHDAMQKAIDDEIARAKAAEKEIADELAKQKDADQAGTLANKIAANDAAIKQEVQDRKNAVQGVQDQLDALAGEGQGSVKDQIDAAKGELQGNIDGVAQDLADFEEEQAEKEAAQDKALEDAVDAIEKAMEDENKARVAEEARIEGLVTAEAAKAREEEGKIREEFAAADTALDNALKAKIEADVAVEKARAEGEEGKIRAEFVAADTALHTTISAEIDADVLVEKNRAEGVEAAIRGEMVTEAARVNQKIADDIAAESALRVAEEQRIEGKVDQEVVDRKGEITRVEGLISAEKGRAEGIEQGLRTDLNQEIQDRKDADDALAEEIERVEGLIVGENSLDGRMTQAEADIDVLEGLVGKPAADGKGGTGLHGALDTAKEEIQGNIQGALNSMNQAVAGEKSRAEGAEAAIRKEMEDEASRVDNKIAADIATESALRQAAEKKIADDLAAEIADRAADEAKLKADLEKALEEAVDAIEGDAGDLADRVAANEAAIEVINGTGNGSIKKAVSDLVDGAPEALDTLNELAAALRDNASVLDAVEQAFDGKLATLQADVDQNEADCDAAIAGEKSRAEGQEAAIRQELAKEKAALQAEIDADVKVVANALADEKNVSKEGSLAKKIADEAARADAAEKALDAKITAIFKAYDGDKEYTDLAPLGE